MMHGFFSSLPQENSVRCSVAMANSDCHLPSAGDALAGVVDLPATACRVGGRGESPDDVEKEERRRAAQRVLGKQG